MIRDFGDKTQKIKEDLIGLERKLMKIPQK
jgi:hypothetical protein